MRIICRPICDAAHEKVPNGENGVRQHSGREDMSKNKQNKNQWKILSSFQDVEFVLEKLKPGNLLKNLRKLIINILLKMWMQWRVQNVPHTAS